MLKHVLSKVTSFSVCKATELCKSRTFTVIGGCTVGDEIDRACETVVFTKEESHLRRVTPKQLSIAVSRRKRLTRPYIESPDSPNANEEPIPLPEHDNKSAKKEKRFARTEANDVHNWRIRYDKVQIAERDALVSYVSKKLGSQLSITRPFQDAYTAPSVIGMSEKDVDSCYDKLLEAGFKKQEAAAILPYLPSCLALDFATLKEMCDILVEYQIGWRPFLTDNCHCLLYPVAIVKTNLELMKEIGMTPQAMGNALRGQPLLFMYSFEQESVRNIKQTKAEGFNSTWVNSIVKQALLNRPAKITLGPDTKDIVHILKQFKVSPDFILKKHHSLFNMKASDLLSILEVLCGDPFYLDNTIIAQILTTCPQHISSINSKEELQLHLTALYNIFTVSLSVQHIIRHINRTPSLINPANTVSDKIAVFEKSGFTTTQSSTIANRAPSVLTQSVSELQKRLQILLDLSGSSPSAIAEAAGSHPTETKARFITNQITDLQSRINFSKKYNEDLCSIDKLNDLFGTSDHQFALLCGSTGAQYLKEAIDNKWLDRKTVNERLSRLSVKNNAGPRKKLKNEKSHEEDKIEASTENTATTD